MITDKLTSEVSKTIKTHELINKNDHVILGISGGPDSVCLFDLLIELSRTMNITIHPVHINHNFRGDAALGDQNYVEKLCESRGLKCCVFDIDCLKIAKEKKLTAEEAGREARYNSFYEVANRVLDDIQKIEKDSEQTSCEASHDRIKIAVAHNADDQAETILFRVIRGAGIDGLSGIPYKRKENEFEVIRPILDIYRRDIEEYCDKRELKPVTDHTNLQDVYTRNSIRLNLLPLIENEYNPNIKSTIIRLGRIAAKDREYMQSEVHSEYNKLIQIDSEKKVILDRERLSNIHEAIRHRIIFKAFARIGLEKDITEERINAADYIICRKQGEKTVQFPHRFMVKVQKGKVIFSRIEDGQNQG